MKSPKITNYRTTAKKAIKTIFMKWDWKLSNKLKERKKKKQNENETHDRTVSTECVFRHATHERFYYQTSTKWLAFCVECSNRLSTLSRTSDTVSLSHWYTHSRSRRCVVSAFFFILLFVYCLRSIDVFVSFESCECVPMICVVCGTFLEVDDTRSALTTHSKSYRFINFAARLTHRKKKKSKPFSFHFV